MKHSATIFQVIQLLQGMAEKGKKEKHEEQVPLRGSWGA